MDITELIQEYENELLNSVIPFWENNGIDNEYGGYFTFLDRDGLLYDTDKFMWMQWRIVYMFATLYNSEYQKEKWLDIAKKGYDFLRKYGMDKSGNYYFALNQTGQPIITPYNIFSEAFATMGAAALYKVTKEENYKNSALESMNNYIKRIDNPKGKWEKSMPDKKKRLNLGHYMILANLGSVIKDCLEIDTYDDDVKNAVEFIVDHFWNKQHQIIFENINEDFTFDMNSCEGRHIIPGHGLEACWFIMQYAENNNRSDILSKVIPMIKSQLEFSWDPKYGGLVYFMDVLGKPHIELHWDMKLWWVHNEAMIATLYAFRLTKDEEFLEWFNKIHEWSWIHFRDPEKGEWFGYLNRRGEPTHLLKGGKWKTFFHLPRYLLECIKQMRLLLS
jgi:N-acylglucosamine 2-epimerase